MSFNEIIENYQKLYESKDFSFYVLSFDLSKFTHDEILFLLNFEIKLKTDLLLKENKQTILFEYLDRLKECYYDKYLIEKTNIEIVFFDLEKEQIDKIINSLWN